MEADKTHTLPSACWRTRKTNGIWTEITEMESGMSRGLKVELEGHWRIWSNAHTYLDRTWTLGLCQTQAAKPTAFLRMRLILLSSSPATNIVTYPMQTTVNYFCLCQSQLFQNNLSKPVFFTFINTLLLSPQWSTFQVPLKSLSPKFEFPKTLTELLVCSTVSVLSCLTGIIQSKDSWWWSSLFRMKSENQGNSHVIPGDQRPRNQELWCPRAGKDTPAQEEKEKEICLPLTYCSIQVLKVLDDSFPHWWGWISLLSLLNETLISSKTPSQTQPEIMFYLLAEYPLA